jgi:5'-nucleotidase
MEEMVAANFVQSLTSKNPSIFISSLPTVTNKITQLMASGLTDLSFTVDFDRTLTAHDSLSSHGALESIESLSDSEYLRLAREVTAKYRPIEIDPMMSIEEKIPHMREWYRQNHELMASQSLSRDQLRQAVKSPKVKFRPGSLELLNLTTQLNVPCCIFSAGLGDVIEHILYHTLSVESLPENLRVVSNRMVFENDLCVGFGDDDSLIHMFNKNQSALSHEERQLFRRNNQILLGDSLGDRTMCDDDAVAERESADCNVLKVGFLNEHVETKLGEYQAAFDIVVVTDERGGGGMEWVGELLELVRGGKEAGVKE